MTEGMGLLHKQNFSVFLRTKNPIYRTFYESYLVSQYLLLPLLEKESPKIDVSSGSSINALLKQEMYGSKSQI